MTAAIGMILLGALLIYMGVKGYSVREALLGRRLVKSEKPGAAR